ncbi:MAG: hypothetical protein KAH12_06145 [Anaerolineales bacterium]|nr:hypothetical protein [Anaerolineales bacterium]
MKHKRSEKGQTALEFMVVAPLVFGAIFLILGTALGWFTHAFGAALAIEGAALEAVESGSGFALVENSMVPGDLQAGFGGSITEKGRTGKLFTITGTFHLPFSPLGFDMDADISSGAIAPVWEFVP